MTSLPLAVGSYTEYNSRTHTGTFSHLVAIDAVELSDRVVHAHPPHPKPLDGRRELLDVHATIVGGVDFGEHLVQLEVAAEVPVRCVCVCGVVSCRREKRKKAWFVLNTLQWFRSITIALQRSR